MSYNIYTTEQIEAMRNWLADCFGHDSHFDADELEEDEVINGVEKYYDGGLRQFFIDSEG